MGKFEKRYSSHDVPFNSTSLGTCLSACCRGYAGSHNLWRLDPGLFASSRQKSFTQEECCLCNHNSRSVSHLFPPFSSPVCSGLSCNENANNPADSAPLPTSPSHSHHRPRPLPEPLREILPDAPETPNPGAARVRQIRSGGRP